MASQTFAFPSSGVLGGFSATLSGLAGGLGLFTRTGTTFAAEFVRDADAEKSDALGFVTPGEPAEAVVRFAPGFDDGGDEAVVRTVCVKLPGIHGAGRDQDFLLASSADGIPFHHAALPAARPDERLYTGLWLYLAGVRPTVFGLRADGQSGGDGFAAGDELTFLVANAISRFHPVGTITLGDEIDDATTQFNAGNSGGGLRPLPPASFYRTR